MVQWRGPWTLRRQPPAALLAAGTRGSLVPQPLHTRLQAAAPPRGRLTPRPAAPPRHAARCRAAPPRGLRRGRGDGEGAGCWEAGQPAAAQHSSGTAAQPAASSQRAAASGQRPAASRQCTPRPTRAALPSTHPRSAPQRRAATRGGPAALRGRAGRGGAGDRRGLWTGPLASGRARRLAAGPDRQGAGGLLSRGRAAHRGTGGQRPGRAPRLQATGLGARVDRAWTRAALPNLEAGCRQASRRGQPQPAGPSWGAPAGAGLTRGRGRARRGGADACTGRRRGARLLSAGERVPWVLSASGAGGAEEPVRFQRHPACSASLASPTHPARAFG